jgi:hypothetical protein
MEYSCILVKVHIFGQLPLKAPLMLQDGIYTIVMVMLKMAAIARNSRIP